MNKNVNALGRRCPRLGGDVVFQYCMQSGEDGGCCFKILDCWWELFDVVTYLQKIIPREKFEKLVDSRPKPKVLSILELIEKAKNNMD